MIGGTSSSIALSKIFNVEFKAVERRDHYVDALLEITEKANVKNIVEKLEKADIKSQEKKLNGRKYLIVPKINTEEVYKKFASL